MLWYNTLALSLAVTRKASGALSIEHKWKKSCFQYPWGKGFLTVTWCYSQFEPRVCLLNGMGPNAIQHLLLILVLLVIQSEVCSVFCPRSRAFTLEWRRIMLALLLLVPCLHSFPAASEPPDPFKGSSAACSIFYWIELQIWRGCTGSKPSI